MSKLSASLVVVVWILAAQTVSAAVRINEIYYSPEQPEQGRQFIELRSTTGGAESLANLWLLEIDGDHANIGSLDDNPGTILTAINLGSTPNPNTGTNGLFLWRDSASIILDPSPDPLINGPAPQTSLYQQDLFPGRVDIGYEGDESGGPKIFENDVVTFLLVEGFTGLLGQDLDTEGNDEMGGVTGPGGNGVFNITPWTQVHDALSIKEPGDPGFQYAGQVGGVNFVGSFGSDIFSWDPVESMWAFFDSGSGEGNGSYVGPFYANDGSGWFNPNGSDAGFQDLRPIVVAPDSRYLYVTPGRENVSGVGGLYRGDVEHDGDVDDGDIDLLYANLGVVGTRFDVALNFGPASQTDVNYLVRNILGIEYGDANLDGTIDGEEFGGDFAALEANYNSSGGWAEGNFNGVGGVNKADLALFNANFLPGNVNYDGQVNIFDIGAISDNWMTDGPRGDANADGEVNIFDVGMASDHWLQSEGAQSVPEPASLALAGLAAVLGSCKWLGGRPAIWFRA